MRDQNDRANKPQLIKDLLARYTRMRAPEGAVLDVVIKAAAQAGMAISKKDIRYAVHTKTVHVVCVGPKKQEILLRRKQILTQCRDALGQKNAPTTIL